MKVLFLTYPRIGLNRGGLQIQIEQTARYLVAQGVDVVMFDPWRNQLEDVDICHIFSIDSSCIYHAERARDMGVPVVVSPVFNAFGGGRWVLRLKMQLAKTVPGFYSDLRRAGKMLECAKRVIALNEKERNSITQDLGVSPALCEIIPNGLSLKGINVDPALFQQTFGVEDFILQVGSIDPNKNQLRTIKAAKKLGKKLVIVGQAAPSQREYLKECKKVADGAVVFTGYIDNSDPLLASAYAGARVFVLPSFKEVMPLVLYEAANAGCSLVVSESVPVDLVLRDCVTRFNPSSVDAIADAIMATFRREEDRLELPGLVASMHGWNDVATSLISVYSRLIES